MDALVTGLKKLNATVSAAELLAEVREQERLARESCAAATIDPEMRKLRCRILLDEYENSISERCAGPVPQRVALRQQEYVLCLCSWIGGTDANTSATRLYT